MAKPLVQHNETLPQIREGLNKNQIKAIAGTSVEAVLEEGHVFQMAEALAAMEEFIKTVRKDERFVQFLRDELAKHGGRLQTASGAKIESCEAGVSYDYSGSAEWKELNDQIQELEERRKQVKSSSNEFKRGYVQLYIEHVEQAHLGADFDFLKGGSGSEVSRDSH